MKKVLFGVFAMSVLIFVACTKENNFLLDEQTSSLTIDRNDDESENGPRFRPCLRGDTVTVDDLPQAALDFISDQFPDETIETVVVKGDEDAYAVKLSNGLILIFDSEGEFKGRCRPKKQEVRRCMKGDSIGVADLPQAILDFVESEFPDETIEAAVVKGDDDAYAVKLSNGLVLIFDSEGEFKGRCRTKKQLPKRCMRGDSIDVADLPQAILDFIESEFPDETIEAAVVKGDDNAYAVKLSNGFVLIFNSDGEFRGRCRPNGPGGPGGPGGNGG